MYSAAVHSINYQQHAFIIIKGHPYITWDVFLTIKIPLAYLVRFAEIYTTCLYPLHRLDHILKSFLLQINVQSPNCKSLREKWLVWKQRNRLGIFRLSELFPMVAVTSKSISEAQYEEALVLPYSWKFTINDRMLGNALNKFGGQLGLTYKKVLKVKWQW